MTRIDFYISQASDETSRYALAMRLCEKAIQQDLTVMLWTNNAQQAAFLDEFLWAHKPESFLPHCTLENPLPNTPVVISSGQDDLSHHGFLINLSHQVPQPFSRFQRLAEIVIQQEPILSATRQSYSFYKQRGYPINTHQV